MSVIVIVGAGMMGSAMTYPAADNENELRLVGTPLDEDIINRASYDGYHITLKRKLPDGIMYYKTDRLDEALKGADLLISGVSSFGIDWFMDNILPRIPDSLPVLSVTKGMVATDEGMLESYPQIYKNRYPQRKLSLNAIGGPCTSYELADKDNTHVCFCGEDIAVLQKLKALLETRYYNISLSTDVFGVECAVALKNAYALGVTLAVGLSQRIEGLGGKEHYNSQAALFMQSVKEMRKILALYGGGDENICFGAGDLYVTVFGGRTRLIGTLLGRGLSFDEAMKELDGVTLESVVIAKRTAAAIRRLIEKGKANEGDFPLLLHIDDIISNNAAVDIPWKKFTTAILKWNTNTH